MATSPNQSARRSTAKLRWIVLHCDASPKESATRSWILSPKSQVSYHWFIHRDGTAESFVPESRVAWACGVSSWAGVKGLNHWSISVAFANRNDKVEPLTDAQRESAVKLCRAIRQRHPSIEGIVTHTMIAPGRKHDPENAPNFRLGDYT